MPLLADLLGAIDSAKRTAGNSLQALVTDPLGHANRSLSRYAQESLPTLADIADAYSVMPGMGDSLRTKLYGMATGNLMPLQTVYHGSPHTFDKFDISKVGTGEGAQAYGHGLYFADSPSVARYYHKNVAAGQGKHFEWADRKGGAVDPYAAYQRASDTYDPKDIAHSMLMQRNSVDEALDDVMKSRAADWVNGDADKKAVAAELLSLQRRGVAKRPSGGVYKVDLPDEHVAKMLDWDKPLSEQPQVVRDLFTRASERLRDPQIASKVTTGEAYGELVGALGGRADASRFLLEQGIPGIRYLDQGSRGEGKGTYNYVVFDDNLLKILERQ